MTIAIAPDRLRRAIEYINEFHDLSAPLSYDIALRILRRTNDLTEGQSLTIRDKHQILRRVATRELGISEARLDFYRKAINAYWRFAPRAA